jgi:hypothetical protein
LHRQRAEKSVAGPKGPGFPGKVGAIRYETPKIAPVEGEKACENAQ